MRRVALGVPVATLVLAGAFAMAAASNAIVPDNVWQLREEARAATAPNANGVFFLGNDRLAISSDRAAWTYVWDLAQGPLSVPVNMPRLGRTLCVSPDRSKLASCTNAGVLALWRTDSLELIAELTAIEQIRFPRAAFSPDGRTLAVANRWQEVDLWDLDSNTRRATLTEHRSSLFELAFSPDGRFLATAGGFPGGPADDESCIKIWDAALATLVATLPTVDLFDNHAIAFAADSSRLFSGGPEGFAAWCTESWVRIYTSASPYRGSWGMDMSPDGRILAVAHWSGVIRLIDTATLQILRELPVGIAADVAFSPDGSRLAACFQDGAVSIWRAPR